MSTEITMIPEIIFQPSILGKNNFKEKVPFPIYTVDPFKLWTRWTTIVCVLDVLTKELVLPAA